ncbi:disease resistance protein TAO1-like isoform X2 [Cucurbita maxima]|uniref:Disease resistance protein TAO1-like isoform X2 n=1 Tax=Cucurbita maxima TaxID=3661 RepID=A0A6J1J6L7_CUCMA|nr:disease resistance protein TAO1-like isoform X2 [Cucurbita maxima]
MAGLLDSVAGNLLGRIIEAVSRPELRHIRSELRNLQTTVSNLKPGLRDAEEKQASDRKLYDLLKNLGNAFSTADDLLEGLDCEYLKWRVQNRKNDVDEKGCQFSSRFSSDFSVSAYKSTINDITEKIYTIEKTMSELLLIEDENEHIKRWKSEMSLRTSITGPQAFSRLLRLKKEAVLSDNVDSIIGRDEAKKSIIDELLKDEDDKQKSRRILSIHGDGGMGKTTLARLVYNDHEVFNHFDKRMWVCVSEDYDVQRIGREILSSATGEKVNGVLTEKRVQIRLNGNFVGRKLLLVLDDFGALDPGRVSEVEKLVEMGANGSKIMITTRSEQTLQDPATHKVQKLDEKQSMALFKQTFGIKKFEIMTEFQSELEELVSKCGGVPLAIKSLAGLLSSEVNYGVESLNLQALIEKWKQEEVKGDGCVLHALRLTYYLMPSYLKPCFLCFSLLPKDHVFFSFELIQLWMAQGLLHSGSKDPEAVGEQYFNELQSLSLLEDVEEHTLGYWFKLHSLVHELAVQQASMEHQNLEILHQLSFVNCNNKELPQPSNDKVHFLFVPEGGGAEPKINGVPLVKCITEFRQLRVLYLCNSSLEEIPTSIDTLKCLRYLDLRGSRRLKRLPESICRLQILQTLILAFCSEFEELPRNIKNMVSLRFLWIQTKQVSLGKDGVGSLTSLRFLAIGGSENLTCLFEDNDKLNSLQTLIIYDCKSLLTFPKGLESSTTLCNMAIWGCERLILTDSLEFLRLKKLILRGLPVFATLPNWIGNSDEDLVVLEVGELPMLRELPLWLSDLWELRILGISNCPVLAGCMLSILQNCDEIKELRITFCELLSQQVLKVGNHPEFDSSCISTIYVDSKIIKLRAASKHKDKDKDKAAVGAKQTKEVNNDERKSDAHQTRLNNADGEVSKKAGTRLARQEEHDRAMNDDQTGLNTGAEAVSKEAVGRDWTRLTRQEEHDRATNDDHHEAKNDGQALKADQFKGNNDPGFGTERPSKAEDCKVKDIDDRVRTIPIMDGAEGDVTSDDTHFGAKQTEETKKDLAATHTHIHVTKVGAEATHDGEPNQKVRFV